MINNVFNIKTLLSKNNVISILILLTIISATALIRRSGSQILEDNYVGYALSLTHKLDDLTYYDSRLFPGFPIMIYLFNLFINNPHISAYVIVFLTAILSYLLLGAINESKENLFIFLFPPIMLDIATKITNEYFSILLILLSVYLFFNGRFSLSAFTSGLSMWVRPIGALLFPSLLISLFIYKKDKITPKLFLSFFLPVLMLMAYNLFFFNSVSPFYQLFVYKEVSPYGNSIGFIQVINDVVRAYKWGQLSIFFSGIFYLGLFIYGIIKIVNHRVILHNIKYFFTACSGTFMILYVFSYSFTPFLENFARYLTPLIILWWIIIKNKIRIPRYVYILIFFSVIMVLK